MKKNLSVLIAGLCFASLFVSCGGNKKAEVKGDVEGQAVPKVHAALSGEYGGASTKLYGHVILADEFTGVKPEPFADVLLADVARLYELNNALLFL